MDIDDIDLDDWDGVYYDARHGEYFRVDTDEGDIVLIHPLTGDAYHTYPDIEDFIDDTDEFHPVDELAVENPPAVVNQLINDALNQIGDRIDNTNVQYALEMTEIVELENSE